MSILFTGDWQASWTNLDKCEQTVQHVLEICLEQQVQTVFHLGDVKEHYSPVDVRVVNFGVRFVQLLVNHGVEVFVLLGNHDRASMSEAADNWFPALRAAGAKTIERSKRVTTVDGTRIAAIPYQATTAAFSTAVRRAAKRGADVLAFHNEVRGAKVNVQTASQTKAVIPFSKFEKCFGGHIHMHQVVPKTNIRFVGSPFAQDWGEANQEKGFVLYRKRSVEFISSKIPGYYDPMLPEFEAVANRNNGNWIGANVRIHVAYDRAAVTGFKAFMDAATAKAREEYPGADITIVPEFLDSKIAKKLKHDGTEEGIIRAYVKQTCPVFESAEALQKLLLRKLKKVGYQQRQMQQIRLLRVKAKNVLCFRKAELQFNPGVTVITGRNEDWPGRNNGTGKTSLMQLPGIALFGRTVKGQANDRWIRRHSEKGVAKVSLSFRLADGRLCTVTRSRRPVKLEFTVAGKSYAAGIGLRGTQNAIEQLTGITWEAMRNAMYVDQAEVSTILRGTPTERKQIFHQLLGFERYASARAIAAQELSWAKQRVIQFTIEKDSADVRIQELRKLVSEVPIDRSLPRRLRIAKRRYVEHSQMSADGLAVRIAKMEKKRDAANQQAFKLVEVVRKLEYEFDGIEKAIKRFRNFPEECPECKQPVSKVHVASKLERLKKRRAQLAGALEDKKRELAVVAKVLNRRDLKVRTLEKQADDLGYKKTIAKRMYERLLEEQRMYIKSKAAIKKQKVRIQKLEQQQIQRDQDLRRACRVSDRLSYAVAAFGKDGIPALLSADICPKLNAAAKEYSELLGAGEIQVGFALNDCDIDVSVINLHGGADVQDQSQGETRIAGLVVGFAIRDIVNPSNVLILDEPSESLDAVNAKVLASGLVKLAQRGGSIVITSHNPYILSALAGERTIEVVKKGGVSKVIPGAQ